LDKRGLITHRESQQARIAPGPGGRRKEWEMDRQKEIRREDVLRAAAYVERKNAEKAEKSRRNHLIALIVIILVGCVAVGLIL